MAKPFLEYIYIPLVICNPVARAIISVLQFFILEMG
jgi:hypothetical protein